MIEYRIPQTLCEYFNRAGLGMRFVPETWRDDCASLWMTSGGSEKTYVDGSKVISLPFEVRIRCDGRSVGARMRAMDMYVQIANQLAFRPPEEYEIAVTSPPFKSAIYENGDEEYRGSYVMRYQKEKKE